MNYGTVVFNGKGNYTLHLQFKNGFIDILPTGINGRMEKNSNYLIRSDVDVTSLKDIHLCYPKFDIRSVKSFCDPAYFNVLKGRWSSELSNTYSYKECHFYKSGYRFLLDFAKEASSKINSERLSSATEQKKIDQFEKIPFYVSERSESFRVKLEQYGLLNKERDLELGVNKYKTLSKIFDKCLYADAIYNLLAFVNGDKEQIFNIWREIAREKSKNRAYPREKFRYELSKTEHVFLKGMEKRLEKFYEAHGNSYIIFHTCDYIDYDRDEFVKQWYLCDTKNLYKRKRFCKEIFSKHYKLIQLNKDVEDVLLYIQEKEGDEYLERILQYTIPSLKDGVIKFWNSKIKSKEVEDSSLIVEIPWEAIAFKENTICIYKYRKLKNIETGESKCQILTDLPIYHMHCEGMHESYNWIKQAFANNLPKIKAVLDGERNVVRILTETVEIERIILQMNSKVQEILDYTLANSVSVFPELGTSFSKASSIPKENVKHMLEKYRSGYMIHLIENCIPDKKIIPCMERRVNTNSEVEEPAFIFTMKDSYKYYYQKTNNYKIVFENVYDNNASIVFDVKKENYNVALQSIYNFFQSDTINKRQKIHNGKIDCKLLHVIGYYAVNHISKSEWIQNLRG